MHCAVDAVNNCAGLDYAGAMAASGEDNGYDAESFRSGLKINIIEMNDEEMVTREKGDRVNVVV